jgi:hypothetical protein
MDGTVREVNDRHLVAVETSHGFSVFEQMGPHFHVGDSVSWIEGLGDGDVRNLTLKEDHRVFFQCRNVSPDSLFVVMRG